MSRNDASYEGGPWVDPFEAGDPDVEDGPIVQGGRRSGVWNRAAAAGRAPAVAVASPPRRALNFAFWAAALVGIFLIVLLLEVVGVLVGAVLVGALEDLTPLGSLLTDDDRLMLLDLFIQLTWLLPFALWWRRLRRGGIGIARPRPARRRISEGESPAAQRAVGVVAMGVGLQVVISILLALILPLFPQVMESYDSMMDDSGTTTLSLLSVLSVAVMAPVVEETTFRGVALQFGLRAVCPGWSSGMSSGELAGMRVSPARFWAANIMQALVFGIMHLNITQGVYAFAIGLVCGWVFWRTGELRWSMGLHAALNLSSYFVGEILDVMSLFGLFDLGQFVFPVLLVYGGVELFARGSEETALR